MLNFIRKRTWFQKLFQLIVLGCLTRIKELSWVDFFKKSFVWVLSFIIDEKNICPVSNPLGICCTGAKSPGAHGPGVQDPGARVPLQGIQGGSVLFHVSKKQEAEPEEVLWAFGPESDYSILLRVHAWGRHSNLDQPSGQVPAEGPCAQHPVPEDWEPDLWGQWTVPGSSQLPWRIRTYPGFPPHCLW